VRRTVIAVGVAVLLVLPFLGTWLRRSPEARCALDGGAIVPSYRVRVQDAAGESREFCCIRCAEIWLERQGKRARAIWVADEYSGAEIDAATAYYVRSLVVTTPTTGNRIHAFRKQVDAEQHVEKFHGAILTNAERPFGNQGKK